MRTVTGSLAAEIPAERAVGTLVPRSEIAAALSGQEVPELVLNLARRTGSGEEERGELGIAWSRDELEQVLGQATGNEIRLTFDREQLALAFGDVEAHGLRGRALVIAVAAAGALGTGATIANAMPVLEPGGGGAAITAAPAAVSDAASGGGYTAPVETASTGLLGGISAPSLSDDLIGGGIILAITGAAFAARRRPGTIRPA